jgi:hypothetical protein
MNSDRSVATSPIVSVCAVPRSWSFMTLHTLRGM